MKNLPDDIRERDIDPPTCSRCSDLEDKVEELKDVLSDALEFLIELELMTRTQDQGRIDERIWRQDLMKCITEIRRLA